MTLSDLLRSGIKAAPTVGEDAAVAMLEAVVEREFAARLDRSRQSARTRQERYRQRHGNDTNNVIVTSGKTSPVTSPATSPTPAPSPPDPPSSPPRSGVDPDLSQPPDPERAHVERSTPRVDHAPTGITLQRWFGEERAAQFSGALPWTIPPDAQGKASTFACGLDGVPAAEVRESMRRFWAHVKAGDRGWSDQRYEQRVAWAFGAWMSRFTELREEIHRRTPRAAKAAAPPDPPCSFHADGRNDGKASPAGASPVCSECAHVTARERKRPGGEATSGDVLAELLAKGPRP